MNILINYANTKYETSRKWNSFTGRYVAKFNKIYAFKPEDITQEFRNENKDILSFKRGNGLWLWKPYIIQKVISHCKNGDIIFYCDSGALFLREPTYVFKNLSEETPMFCCDIPLLESCFTKAICFEKMHCNNASIKDSNQIIATYFAVYVCNKTRKFVEEWLNFCCDPELMYPEGSITNLSMDKGKSFVAHREDQSIFSLLCKKYNFLPHKDISQRGNDPMSYYNPHYAYKEPKHDKDKDCKTILYLHKSSKIGITYFLRNEAKNLIIKLRRISHK